MIYRFETSDGYCYYLDSDNQVFMTLADYATFTGKSVQSLAHRDAETVEVTSGTESIDLISQKTILQWLMKDKPDFILQFAINGLHCHLNDITPE